MFYTADKLLSIPIPDTFHQPLLKIVWDFLCVTPLHLLYTLQRFDRD